MKIVRGLQQYYSSGAYLYKNIIVWCLFILSISMRCNVIYAKHLEPHQLTEGGGVGGIVDHHYQNGDNSGGDEDNTKGHCESVKNYFDSLNVTIMPDYENTGSICGGHCCSNATEDELMIISTNNFDRELRHHTRSLRDNLESTAKTFRGHILELTFQSENKTLNLFSQVYGRMSPFSRQPISELYRKIRNHISGHDESDFDAVVRQFFMELFPVAYHHAVHSSSNTNSDKTNGDFHIDYKNCLMHTYDDLQPFGVIPKLLAKSIKQSINAATIFVQALDRGADILASTEELDSDYLTSKCRHHLMKMNYCPGCKGISKHRVKSCYGYCTNVMRGCLAQYVGVLDNPWSNVAESIEALWHNSIKTDKGIEEVIKALEAKLSEAIMYAMENGPDLEKKVKKSCGTPTLLPTEKLTSNSEEYMRTTSAQTNHHSKLWVSPPNTEMLRFLVNIDKSKDFYSKIVDRVCEDDDYSRSDKHCWTGDRIGEYKQTVMSIGVDAQRYNPEVPLEGHSYVKANKLNELVDKLIKLRHTVSNAMTMYSPQAYSDIQGDMARHDEEGSGGYRDDIDDDEYNSIVGSGDGSGDGSTSSSSVPRFTNNNTNDSSTGSATGQHHNRISFTIVFIPILIAMLLLPIRLKF